jgi:hypothetical protein
MLTSDTHQESNQKHGFKVASVLSFESYGSTQDLLNKQVAARLLAACPSPC